MEVLTKPVLADPESRRAVLAYAAVKDAAHWDAFETLLAGSGLPPEDDRVVTAVSAFTEARLRYDCHDAAVALCESPVSLKNHSRDGRQNPLRLV